CARTPPRGRGCGSPTGRTPDCHRARVGGAGLLLDACGAHASSRRSYRSRSCAVGVPRCDSLSYTCTRARPSAMRYSALASAARRSTRGGPTMAKGTLIAAMNIGQAAEDEFHDWYDTEHLPERQRVAGFFVCRRWIGAQDRKVSVAT